MSGSSSKMKLKKLNLFNHDFNKFIKQIDEDSFYLVKYGKRWHSGRITFCGVGARNYKEKGSSWGFSLGLYETQLSSRLDNKLDEDFKQVYEIIDPEIMAEKAKTLLEGEKHDERSE